MFVIGIGTVATLNLVLSFCESGNPSWIRSPGGWEADKWTGLSGELS